MSNADREPSDGGTEGSDSRQSRPWDDLEPDARGDRPAGDESASDGDWGDGTGRTDADGLEEIGTLAFLGTWTGALVVLFVAVFAVQFWLLLEGGEEQVARFAFDTADLSTPSRWPVAVLSTVAHGGLFHLFINASVFAQFGLKVERRLAGRRFLALFFGAGTLAAVVQVGVTPLVDGGSSSVVGASGGIAAILGLYCVAEPDEEITVYVPIGVETRLWKALTGAVVLTLLVVFAFGPDAGGIAHLAHLAGLFSGVLVGLLALVGRRLPGIANERTREPQW